MSLMVLWWFLSIEPHQVQISREGYHAASPLSKVQAGVLSPKMDFSHFSRVSLPNFVPTSTLYPTSLFIPFFE